MPSPRLALGTALAVLFGLTMSHGALGQRRPPPEDEIMRRTPPPRPTPVPVAPASQPAWVAFGARNATHAGCEARSEEHTSELQSLRHLVCRLLLEKKKKKKKKKKQ